MCEDLPKKEPVFGSRSPHRRNPSPTLDRHVCLTIVYVPSFHLSTPDPTTSLPRKHVKMAAKPQAEVCSSTLVSATMSRLMLLGFLASNKVFGSALFGWSGHSRMGRL